MTGTPAEHYDLILVGSSFASAFFLKRYLEKAPASARVLVLERGARVDYVNLKSLGDVDALRRQSLGTYHNATPEKEWTLTACVGGTSNTWWACASRFLPEDFELKSRYGVGADWPLRYDDLEPYYTEVEEVMEVSGPMEPGPWPRSRPFPQPPHRLTEPDKVLKKAFPDSFFVQPCARARVTTKNGRPRCCASGICAHCPIDSKFSVLNSMMPLLLDPRVTLRPNACVAALDVAGSVARGVLYRHDGMERRAMADLVGLGANAIFNPFLLLKSGLDGPQVGRGLVEQGSEFVLAHLNGIENFTGSTSITGQGYMFYAGEHRARYPGALVETYNMLGLRDERGKWRQQIAFKLIYEDLRQEGNFVALNPDDPERPLVRFAGISPYAEEGFRQTAAQIDRFLAPLPVEKIAFRRRTITEGHIVGTTVMGNDPATSVLDRHLLHHRVRNLAVLGSGAFPTCTPSQPTLTLAALSLWCADHLLGSAAP